MSALLPFRLVPAGVLLAILSMTTLTLPSVAGAAIRGLHGVEKFACHGILVLPGDTRRDVVGKCGDPAWRQSLNQVSPQEEFSVPTEEWVYEFGHSQLLQFLRFRDGRLVTIRTSNYGFGGSRNGDCAYGDNFFLGDSKLEVVAKCGEPTSGETGGERVVEEGNARRDALLSTDEWIYDFGPDRFVHYLTFRYGRLMEIRIGGYGR